MSVMRKMPPATIVTPNSFRPEVTEDVVKGGTLDHVQIGKGQTRGRIIPPPKSPTSPASPTSDAFSSGIAFTSASRRWQRGASNDFFKTEVPG